MDPQEIMCEGVKWIHLAQLLWQILMNFGYKAGIWLEYLSDYKRLQTDSATCR
jgi:hypothetical protein